MHKSENSLRRQIFDCFTAVRLILKNQSTKTREHFLSSIKSRLLSANTNQKTASGETEAAFTRIRIDLDIRMSPAPDRPSVYTKTIEVYAIRSNTLRYPELFENDFKGGSSGCPGALWRRVNGASGYPDVTAHALYGFLRLESGFFLLLFASFKNFSSLFFLSVNSTIWFKSFPHSFVNPFYMHRQDQFPADPCHLTLAVFYSR